MKITARSLFEIAGIPIPYVLLIEGYKEATAEFSAISPDAPAKIAQYKDLVKRNQAQGDERNIDYWRKQGWDAFVAFVDKKSSGPTKTQLKRKKVVGQSITLREDDEWLIVIPLDKDASCFHGKNSDWCTTKYTQPQFEEYFYNKEVVLVYCLNKTNGGTWALAGHKQAKGKLEIFDQRDDSITAEEFKSQTGLIAAELISLALAQSKPIDNSRSNYLGAKRDTEAKLRELPRGVRDVELEQVIGRYKFNQLAMEYLSGEREASEEVQNLAVRHHYDAIQFIKTPSEEIQKLAVQQNGLMLKHIKNPSEEIQKLAVERSAYAIQYIENPSEELQKIAILHDTQRHVIRYIKNPSEEIQKLAVQQRTHAIKDIKNPSEDLQNFAVRKSEQAIEYINSPTPAVVALHNELWGNK